MPVLKSSYKPHKLTKNGHVQTMYPFFFRKVKGLDYDRYRIELTDGDFLDLDCLDADSDSLVILSHGLEGSSEAPYIKGMSKYFQKNENLDVIAWNMRSCSGELNRLPHFYHAAMTDDLQAVINFALSKKDYKNIYLVGFSLGANLNAYYLGSLGNRVSSKIKKSIMFSTPLCLGSCIEKLHSSKMGQVYANSFIKTMKQKVLQKYKLGLLKGIDIKAIKKAKTFRQFDDLVTAPLCGFNDAEDYYQYASAINLLDNIRVPTLLVQAKDDPFLIEKSFPFNLAQNHDYLHLEVTPSGGHVGFLHFDQGLEYWAEHRASQFILEGK